MLDEPAAGLGSGELDFLSSMICRSDRADIQRDMERVYELFPALAKLRFYAGADLSGGQQQMLAIGRALMSRPKLL